MVRHSNGLLRKVVEFPCLEAFKGHVDAAPKYMVYCWDLVDQPDG